MDLQEEQMSTEKDYEFVNMEDTYNVSDMVTRFNTNSKYFLKEYYSSLADLYWELDFLYNLLNYYSIGKIDKNNAYNRKEETADIRRRVREIYEYIKYYKQCINTEKQEKKRLRETYGYFSPKKYKQVKAKRNIDNEEDNESYTNYSHEEYDFRFDENYLEEVRDYKYNFVTDRYE